MKTKTYYRLNGCGLTISPIPEKGVHSISTKWITFFFIPLIPLGFFYVVGLGEDYFKVIKRIPVAVVLEKLPLKNILSILLYPFFEGVFFLGGFILIIVFFSYLHTYL